MSMLVNNMYIVLARAIGLWLLRQYGLPFLYRSMVRLVSMMVGFVFIYSNVLKKVIEGCGSVGAWFLIWHWEFCPDRGFCHLLDSEDTCRMFLG